MNDPVLHVLAGPNGSGKSTFAAVKLIPTLHLPFVNADLIAAARWPGEEERHAYDASRAAAEERERLLAAHASFITETVFSHPSKLALVARARSLGYLVSLHVMLLPVDVTVARVAERVAEGGHAVPEPKIRERHERLWPLILQAVRIADRATFYDNARRAAAFRVVARVREGRLDGEPDWPAWTPFDPAALR